MSDLKERLDRELARVFPAGDARAAVDTRVARRRRRRVVLLPIATLILTAGLVAGLTYAFSSDGPGTRDDKPGISLPVNQIAFTSYRDGRLMDIYLMNTDGTGAIRLTDSGAEDLLPAWSPDGSRIAFGSTRSVGPPHTDGHIFIMNADGTGQRRLVFDLSNAGSPAWSPDGTKIAFAGCCRPGWDIYVINEDGTGLVQLTSDEQFDSSPDWSPDGSRIVFGRDDDGTGPKMPSHGLYLMSADGTRLRQLTRGYGAQPAWSPARSSIAFARSGNGRGIYLIDPSSGEEIRLTSGEDTEPAWSPDGTKMAFTSYRGYREGDIFVMESDGSHQTQITDNPFGDYEPAWQPAPAAPSPSAEASTCQGALDLRPRYLPWVEGAVPPPHETYDASIDRDQLSWSGPHGRGVGLTLYPHEPEGNIGEETDVVIDGVAGRLHREDEGDLIGMSWNLRDGRCNFLELNISGGNWSKERSIEELMKVAKSLRPVA